MQTVATPDAVRAAVPEELERLLASEFFRNSKQAERLLRYLVRHSLEEHDELLRERVIGEKVFGRAPMYDSNADSIVRSWANHLRKRLTQYYHGPGSNSAVRFAIPPGSYRVEFHPQAKETRAPLSRAVAAVGTDADRLGWIRPRPSVALAWGLSVVLAGACGVMAIENAQLRSGLREPKIQAPLNLLWSRMLGGKQACEIVLADSNLSLFQDLSGKPVSLQEYVRHSYLLMEAHDQKGLSTLMMRRYTSLADVEVLRRTLLLSPESGRLEVVFARDFVPDDLKRRNIILVGSTRANPWVEPFVAQMNFRFDYGSADGLKTIVNTHPKAGEQARYFNARPSEEISESYGLLAFQPNLARTGNALIIAGLDAEGTLAAGELATNLDLFKQVAGLLRASGKLPYFEVLLKAQMVGSSVHGFRIVAWR